MHTKHGNIDPAHTPDTENKLTPGEKQGAEKQAIEQLDDDTFNRLAKRAASAGAPLYERLAKK